MTAIADRCRIRRPSQVFERAGWSRVDTLWAGAWMLLAVAARAPLVARIEGVLDHDQSIVGLMALDIAALKRWPIFFDGQRYMGAVEPYVSALFVGLFGHSPVTVALSPLLFFGLFTAGQFALWRCWSGRTTGHLAALVSVLGAPMFVLWSIVPRGGYIELLAWALPTLGVYRRVTQPDRPPLSAWKQAAWGFLLGLGYFLNPLSLIVYLTMAVDWTLGRHGAELRSRRHLEKWGLDSPRGLLIWGTAALGLVVALAVCCHIEFQRGAKASPYVFLLDALPPALGAPLGVLGILLLLGGAGWWTGALPRAFERLAGHLNFAFGALLAWSPFVLYNMAVASGRLPAAQSLPIWIRAPWQIGRNLRDGRASLGVLIGCDPDAPASVLIGQGVELPSAAWPHLTRLLSWCSPALVVIVLGSIASLAWSNRGQWRRFWSLRGQEPTSPTVLALLMLGVCAGLYLLQATSPNASSVRYLVPTWIILPGLIAAGLRALPRRAGVVLGAILLSAWTAEQANLWADLNRPSPLRPLATELERRGVRGIVAETPVALMVANLSRGKVGVMEFRSKWPRVGSRYLGRFEADRPLVCVDDVRLSWFPGESKDGALLPNLGQWLEQVSREHPERIRLAWTLGYFKVWEVDLPLSQVLQEGGAPLPPEIRSATLSPIETDRRIPAGN